MRSAAPTRAANFTGTPMRAEPDGLVGARAAGTAADRGAAVGAADQRALGEDDDVGHHVADDDDVTGHLSAASAVAMSAATAALCSTSAMLATSDLPPVSSKMRLRRNGVSALRETPSRSAPAMASAMRSSIAAASSAALFGDRVGDEDAAKTLAELDFQQSGDGRGVVEAVVDGVAAGAGPEGGELVGLVADDRDALGLEDFEGLGDIEDRLGAGADDGDRGAAQLLEVGGDVEGRLGAAVDAADAAGRKDADAGLGRGHHRRRDRGSGKSAAREQGRDVAARGLCGGAAGPRQPLKVRAFEADAEALRP